MCRMAAFPPNFPRDEALQILTNFAEGQKDGTGYVYLKNEEFVIEKNPAPLKEVANKRSFLGHMPYNGWTLAHLRAASHGKALYRNTHPFVKGDYAVTHNGVWHDHTLSRITAVAMGAKFKGETDSETAAHLLSLIGPRAFYKVVDAEQIGGVFFALERTGDLWAMAGSGDLVFAKTKRGILLASELPEKYEKNTDVDEGWINLNAKGRIEKSNFKQWSYKTYVYGKGTEDYGGAVYFPTKSLA